MWRNNKVIVMRWDPETETLHALGQATLTELPKSLRGLCPKLLVLAEDSEPLTTSGCGSTGQCCLISSAWTALVASSEKQGLSLSSLKKGDGRDV